MSQPDRDAVDSPTKPRPLSDSTLYEHSQSYVRPVLLTNWPLKCAYVVDEILTTERDYLASLRDIIEGYKNPLSGRLRMTNEGQKIVQTIFSNVEDLHSLHKWLLDQLNCNEGDPHRFGKIFSDNETRFKLYSIYCTNYDTSLETLTELLKQHRDMDEFLLSCQKKLGHSLPLTSYLIKPVQRIMRYHLLLRELVKKFDPNLSAHRSLSQAHDAMVRIANHVNEVKKQRENALRAQDIQSCLTGWSNVNLSAYGRLIRESTCKVGKRGVERQVILFEKLLLILKKKDLKRYNYKGHILTQELCIDKDSASKPTSSFKVFSRGHTSQTFVIEIANTKLQAEWVSEITMLLKSFTEIKRQEDAEFEKLVKQSSRSVKRRPMTFHEEPRYRYGSSHSKRMIGPRKRPRPDIRDMFHEEEESGVQLKGVTKLSESPPASTYPPPAGKDTQNPEASLKYVRVSDQSDVENDPNLLNMFPPRGMKSSKSSDSLLSLGDVELGVGDVDCVTGEGVPGMEGVDEVDSPPISETGERPTPKRTFTRKAAIKVKKSGITPSTSYSSIIRIRADETRRAVSTEASMEDELERDHQSGDEESEESDLSRLLSTPQTSINLHSLADETSQPMEYDSVYQSVGLDASGGPPTLDPNATGTFQIEIEDLSPTDKVSSESGCVYDSGLGELEGSTTQRVGLDGQEEAISQEDKQWSDEEEHFVIEADSSDSEDEEDEDSFEELPSELIAMDTDPSPHGEFPEDGELSTEQEHEDNLNQSLSSGELSQFFHTLRRGDSPTPQDQSHDLRSTTVTDPVDSLETPDVYQFKGQPTELSEIYTTLPRKQRSKLSSPSPKSQMIGPHPSNSHVSQSTHTLSRSAARRADGFSRLLEFTRQQRTTPEMSPIRQLSAPGGYEVTQSLPVANFAAKSLDNILECEPIIGNDDDRSEPRDDTKMDSFEDHQLVTTNKTFSKEELLFYPREMFTSLPTDSDITPSQAMPIVVVSPEPEVSEAPPINDDQVEPIPPTEQADVSAPSDDHAPGDTDDKTETIHNEPQSTDSDITLSQATPIVVVSPEPEVLEAPPINDDQVEPIPPTEQADVSAPSDDHAPGDTDDKTETEPQSTDSPSQATPIVVVTPEPEVLEAPPINDDEQVEPIPPTKQAVVSAPSDDHAPGDTDDKTETIHNEPQSTDSDITLSQATPIVVVSPEPEVLEAPPINDDEQVEPIPPTEQADVSAPSDDHAPGDTDDKTETEPQSTDSPSQATPIVVVTPEPEVLEAPPINDDDQVEPIPPTGQADVSAPSEDHAPGDTDDKTETEPQSTDLDVLDRAIDSTQKTHTVAELSTEDELKEADVPQVDRPEESKENDITLYPEDDVRNDELKQDLVEVDIQNVNLKVQEPTEQTTKIETTNGAELSETTLPPTELRKRPISTPSGHQPSSISEQLLTSQPDEKSEINPELPIVALSASSTARIGVLGRLQRLISGWLSRLSLRSGLIVLSVIAVSSIVVYASIHYSSVGTGKRVA